ncbi:hypothetical protein WJX81_004767, partial [Elliptochloris bilobata]
MQVVARSICEEEGCEKQAAWNI